MYGSVQLLDVQNNYNPASLALNLSGQGSPERNNTLIGNLIKLGAFGNLMCYWSSGFEHCLFQKSDFSLDYSKETKSLGSSKIQGLKIEIDW